MDIEMCQDADARQKVKEAEDSEGMKVPNPKEECGLGCESKRMTRMGQYSILAAVSGVYRK